MVFTILQIILFVLQVIVLLPVAYLILLTVAAWTAKRVTPERNKEPWPSFLFLIPAHNEEILLPDLLGSIARIEYPKPFYQVHVVADNCSDSTAAIAAQYGAQVHIRQNEDLIGKGYALEWALKEIRTAGQMTDAVIIVDADSTVSSNFLSVMRKQVASGVKVSQAYYGVREPGLSWNVSLRYAALAVLHFLRPQGRMALGGSAGLKGNGMMFAQEVLAQHPWPSSVTEDIEYHMLLLLGGITVKFAPDAAVWGEMPEQFEQSQSQLDRWESGRIQMARKYIPLLLKAAVQALYKGDVRWTYRLVDAVIEHLIPPFSLLFGVSCLLLLVDAAFFLAAALFPGLTVPPGFLLANVGIGIVLVAGQIIYLLSGLKMANAPKVVYRQLLFAPVFILRKVGQYVRVLSGSKPDNWVKTTRNNHNGV